MFAMGDALKVLRLLIPGTYDVEKRIMKNGPYNVENYE